MSIREAARAFGLHRDTARKMLKRSAPPGYQRSEPPRSPKLDPFKGVIPQILQDDPQLPKILKISKKQRHTAKRIYHRQRGRLLSTPDRADNLTGRFRGSYPYSSR